VPLEAGCALVRDRQALLDTFAHRPAYYHYGAGADADAEITHFHELGLQNSRGFRALKVWLALRAGGRAAYTELVTRNIRLARDLFRLVDAEPELEAATQNLSITTFRYVPRDLDPARAGVADYLNALNSELVLRIQKGGEAHLSNAVVDGRFLLRTCITNFRSTSADVEMLPGLVVRLGRELDAEMRPQDLEC
jgi:glutamate/tyrosine decarboxylase-like PLP-dependent enzyme